MQRRLCTLAAAFVVLTIADAFSATVNTWNGGTGSWDLPSNWSAGVVPNNAGGNTYDVRIDGSKPVPSTVTLGSSTGVDQITIDSGDRLNTANNPFVIRNGGSATVNGILSLDPAGRFLWDGLGATLNGNGQFRLAGGLVNPNSPGSSARLTNNMLINGYGDFGIDLGFVTGLLFDNNNYIINEQATPLTIRSRNDAASESRNYGTIRAAPGGVVNITHGTIRQFAGFTAFSGSIEANGGGAASTLNIRSGVRIIGGNIDCYQGPGAVVNIEGGVTFDHDSNQSTIFGNGNSFVSQGTMNIQSGATLNGIRYFVNIGGRLDFKPGSTHLNACNLTVQDGTVTIGQGVTLDGTSIDTWDGVVQVANVDTNASAVLRNVTVSAQSSARQLQIGSTSGFGYADVQGTLTNNGTLSVITSTSSSTASRILLSQDATFTGSGRVLLEPSTAALFPRILATTGTQTLTNAENHRIEGTGAIGDVAPDSRPRLLNAGTIDNTSGTMRIYLNAGAQSNTGIIRSESNILLGNLSAFTFDNAGLIVAQAAGSMVQVGGNFSGPGTRGTFTGNGEWRADGGLILLSGDVAFNTSSRLVARNGGQLVLSPSTLNAASINVEAGSSAQALAPTSINADVANNGNFVGRPMTVSGFVTGPKLAINGNVTGVGSFAGNNQFAGATNPGNGAGVRGLLTNEVLTLTATHVYTADLAGTTDADRIVVGGEAVIAGRLQLNRVGGYVPAYGVTHRLVLAGFSSGTFSSVGGVAINPRHAFAVWYDIGGTLATCTYPGDATLDLRVNFDDLLLLAQQYGRTSGQTWKTADFTGDGATNFDDLLSFAQNYGLSALQGDGGLDVLHSISSDAFASDFLLAMALVPEPTSFAMALFGMTGTVTRRRQTK